MKALLERLEWIKLALCELSDGPTKTAALECWIGCEAIAEALPELAFKSEPQRDGEREPPERIIDLPDRG